MILNRAEIGMYKRFEWSAGSLIRACGLVLCLLLTLGAKSAAPGEEIHKAVIKGDLNKVVALLKDRPDALENKNKLGYTPLFEAVGHNQMEIAELLLANGADVNARDGYGHTPLIQALWVYNHDKMMRLLLAKGADVNLSDKWEMTALAYAAKQGQLEDAKILIASDANVNCAQNILPGRHSPVFRGDWNSFGDGEAAAGERSGCQLQSSRLYGVALCEAGQRFY